MKKTEHERPRSYFRIVKLFDRQKVTVCSDRTI